MMFNSRFNSAMQNQSSKLTRGFTVIELMVVFGTLSLLATLGIASFVSYSRTQALNTASFDVVTTLQVAKSRARTQVKPTTGNCSALVLDGYRVRIINDTSYALEIQCEGSFYTAENGSKELPNNPSNKTITFSSGSIGKVFLFKVLSGSVTVPSSSASDTIVIDSFGNSKTITVHANGKITIQ